MDYFDNIIEKYADPRVKNWFFISSPLPTIIVSIIYVIFVTKIGPELMKHKKPYKLTRSIIIYNAFQIVLSTYIFYALSRYGWMRFNNLFCEPVNQEEIEVASACWWYFFAKFTEFFDTVFFLLRKKYNQISSLHVLHHGVMPTIAWIGVKYTPGGTGSVFGVINSFVHIIMYSYYMFAAMGPKYQKYLWWKKYITVLQLVQFVIILSHSTFLIVSDCNINKAFSYAIVAVAFIFFILFSDFYKKTYNTKEELNKKHSNNNVYEKPGPSFMPQENKIKPKRI